MLAFPEEASRKWRRTWSALDLPAPLRPVKKIDDLGRHDGQADLLFDLAAEGLLERFSGADFAAGEGPELLAGGLLNQKDVAVSVLNPRQDRNLFGRRRPNLASQAFSVWHKPL